MTSVGLTLLYSIAIENKIQPVWPDLHSILVLVLPQVFLQTVLLACVFGEVICVCLLMFCEMRVLKPPVGR